MISYSAVEPEGRFLVREWNRYGHLKVGLDGLKNAKRERCIAQTCRAELLTTEPGEVRPKRQRKLPVMLGGTPRAEKG